MSDSEQRTLRVLVAEDSEDDALLVIRELRRNGYAADFRRVDSAQEMRAALIEGPWDLIITDHNMPGFNSSHALEIAREFDPNIPFILVSGSIGEEVAVDAMKSGAHDYVMKNNLTRLLPAIERELREAENRRAHQRAQEQIRYMAFHDNLTGLINRAEFEKRLGAAVERARSGGEGYGLAYLDLDQFKLVNDSCGHLAGDELLRQLARRLQARVREGDVLARIGGDEFGLLLSGCSMKRARQVANELIDIVRSTPFVWGGRVFRVGCSVGLAPIDGNQPPERYLSMADMACYVAKDRGRNQVHVYQEGDAELSRRQGEMEWAQRLQKAMDENSLVLHGQRIRCLRGGTDHIEILLRLSDAKEGLIGPDRFLPAAERYSLMPEIDRWVTAKVCQALQQRQDHVAASPRLFVNLSGASLSDVRLFDDIETQVKRCGIPADRLGFEVTETAAIADLDCATRLIRRLRQGGHKVAIDDFGTGMSSFAYLKNLPVDYLKIDGSFVVGMLDDQRDEAIVEAVNKIGHLSGMQTIAEFVESPAILHRLQALGVDYAQGWAVHRPEPLDRLSSEAEAVAE